MLVTNVALFITRLLYNLLFALKNQYLNRFRSNMFYKVADPLELSGQPKEGQPILHDEPELDH